MSGKHRPSRRVSVNDKVTGINFLVDTGADVSVFPITAKEKNCPFQCTLQAANKTPIKTYGERLLTLNLGLRRTFKWIFTLADVSQPIIGADFLNQFSLLVDIKNCRLVDSTTSLSIPGFYSSTPTLSPSFSIDTSISEFHALLGQYPNLLKPQYSSAAYKHDVTHHICTNGPPVNFRPRRLAADRLKTAKQEFTRNY